MNVVLVSTSPAVTEMHQHIHKPTAIAIAVSRVWNPAFQAEDFIDSRINRISSGSSKTVIDTESEICVGNREEMEKIIEKEKEEDDEKEEK